MKASRQRMVDTLPWHDDALLAGSNEDEPLSEEERVAEWDSEYWTRLDAEVRYFGSGR